MTNTPNNPPQTPAKVMNPMAIPASRPAPAVRSDLTARTTMLRTRHRIATVSYTHLTLPTSDLV